MAPNVVLEIPFFSEIRVRFRDAAISFHNEKKEQVMMVISAGNSGYFAILEFLRQAGHPFIAVPDKENKIPGHTIFRPAPSL